MKKSLIKLLLTAVLAVVGTSVNAATIAFENGDLILGFRATSGFGAGTNLVINLGAGYTYRDANNSPISLGNFNADLEAAFGVGWSSRSDIQFGIVGNFTNSGFLPSGPGTITNGDGVRTIYASNGTEGFGMTSTINMGSIASLIQTLNGAVSSYEAAGTAVSAIVNASDTSSWSSFATMAQPFGGVGDSFEKGFSGGTGSIDLYRYVPRTSELLAENPPAPLVGVYQGTFTIGSNGDINYGTVPEPSTYALVGLGLASLLVVRRMKKNAGKALKA